MIEGQLDGTRLHIGVVVASWNQTITDRLLDGAIQRCEELGVEEVTVVRVPGAESSSGITAVSIKTGVPVTNAILAVHDFADAVARSGEGDANKGVEAVDAAVLTSTAIKKLEQD